MAFRRRRLEPRLRPLPKPLGPGLDQSGIEQFGQMLVERLQVRARSLGLGQDVPAEDLGAEDLGAEADFRGAGIDGIWGESGVEGRAARGASPLNSA